MTLGIKESEEFIDLNLRKLELQEITEQVMVKSETRTSTKWNRREKWDAEHTQNKLKFLQGEINKKQKLCLNCSYYWNTINKQDIKTYKKLWTWKITVLSKTTICHNYPMKAQKHQISEKQDLTEQLSSCWTEKHKKYPKAIKDKSKKVQNTPCKKTVLKIKM